MTPMKPTILIVVLLGLITSAHGQTPRRTMAVTFDDLPYVNFGDDTYVKNARAATVKILSTLKKHKVPAVGFVNEDKLANSRERIALLRQWVEAGMVLGVGEQEDVAHAHAADEGAVAAAQVDIF